MKSTRTQVAPDLIWHNELTFASSPERAFGNALMGISAIVLTHNESQNIGICLESIRHSVGEVFVVDSGSTDGTASMARLLGATVYHHDFVNHTDQWAWALSNLPLTFDWVLGLDADQRFTAELATEVSSLFAGGGPKFGDVVGMYVNRRTVFRGRWLRHGGLYPKYLLKLFRRDSVRLSRGDLLDHHFYVDGPVLRLRSDLIEENRKENDLEFFVAKHLRYAKLSAQEERRRRGDRTAWPINARLGGTPDERTVWLKQRWYRLPLYVRPVLLFVYRFVVRGGFLDGTQGFIFHMVQSLFFRMLVDMYLDEMPASETLGHAGSAEPSLS